MRRQPESLARAIKRALDSDPRLDHSETADVRVKAFGGEVILAGTVSTDEVRVFVLHVASQVSGVQQVRNKLRTDAELADALRDRLRLNPLTAIAPVEASVVRGVAELRGSAPYDAQLAAIKMARAVAGIRDVVSHLELSTGLPA